ncbi:hypothetical protein KDD17_02355 [Sulfitobacter albidus]|uniref:Uncharacterized protein n=1 Tax=Sulfitobacter albidus TaxID=2829501 RepID=A0A975PML4_9RHOB|nr:hypothetical protein [Sulfitobacter albidus]QUJ76923.1 hypothetical protein KDD17_02355 [Sulfitobacter albidus]
MRRPLSALLDRAHIRYRSLTARGLGALYTIMLIGFLAYLTQQSVAQLLAIWTG